MAKPITETIAEITSGVSDVIYKSDNDVIKNYNYDVISNNDDITADEKGESINYSIKNEFINNKRLVRDNHILKNEFIYSSDDATNNYNKNDVIIGNKTSEIIITASNNNKTDDIINNIVINNTNYGHNNNNNNAGIINSLTINNNNKIINNNIFEDSDYNNVNVVLNNINNIFLKNNNSFLNNINDNDNEMGNYNNLSISTFLTKSPMFYVLKMLSFSDSMLLLCVFVTLTLTNLYGILMLRAFHWAYLYRRQQCTQNQQKHNQSSEKKKISITKI
ncbi:hypothetical protein HELRODRAFT_183205 [Helobdella robusta]|uniref:Uncharacterized protein n=1 Tax=Helobdella robusta TaxID=6412 RepID=T1FJB0_HELRO|nr:hypothetical protein HELRODRAFT_183205 [Helobdella robusta]ESO11419.1 hypothetical protein HELRODRAFT_183205 [Helobdella robusta]